MSEIKGPGGVGGPKAPQSVRGERAEGPGSVAVAQPGAEVTAADPMAALFSAVADQLASSGVTDRGVAVRAAVDAVLARELPQIPAAVRAATAEDVSTSLLARPELVARLDRLLGLSG